MVREHLGEDKVDGLRAGDDGRDEDYLQAAYDAVDRGVRLRLGYLRDGLGLPTTSAGPARAPELRAMTDRAAGLRVARGRRGRGRAGRRAAGDGAVLRAAPRRALLRLGRPAAGVGLPGPAVVHAAARAAGHRGRAAPPGRAAAACACWRSVGIVLLAVQFARLLGAARGGQVLTAVVVAASACHHGGRAPALDRHLRHPGLDGGAGPGHPGRASTDRPRLWLLAGVVAGVGLNNKHALVFLLGAILVACALDPRAAARAAHPLAVAGRAHRRADVGPEPALAGRPRLAGLRPLRRHRRRVRRPRRPARARRPGGDHVQPADLRRVDRSGWSSCCGGPSGAGPGCRPVVFLVVLLVFLVTGGKGYYLAGAIVPLVAAGCTWVARSRSTAPAGRRSAPCSPLSAAVAWPGAGPGAAGVDVRRLVLPRASTTTSPRRSAGRSTPTRSGPSWPTSRTAPSSSPATTARPVPSSGTASARRSTAATTAGANWGPPPDGAGPVVVVVLRRPGRRLHRLRAGRDAAQRRRHRQRGGGPRRLGLRRPDRLVVGALGELSHYDA